jgi:hypothetical protein
MEFGEIPTKKGSYVIFINFPAKITFYNYFFFWTNELQIGIVSPRTQTSIAPRGER